MKKNILRTLIGIKWLFVCVMVIICIYPVAYAVLGSLKTNFELTSGGSFLPEVMQFSNYVYAWQQANFFKYTINSILISCSSMAISLLISSMAGFVFARKEFFGKKQILAGYLAFMFVSLGAVTIYPIFSLFETLGLTNSFIGLSLVLTGSQATNIFLIMGFVKGIPKSMDEAAYLEGCTDFQTYYMIILPLIRPILGVVALFAFRTAWNDFIKGMIMTIPKPDLMPLTVAVVQLKYSVNAAAEWHIMLAGSSIALIPILILYVFAHKQFIGGLTAGATKG